MSRPFRFAGPLVLAAFSCVALFAAPAQEKVQVSRKAKVGDAARATTEAVFAINAAGRQATLQMKATERTTVTEIASDGRVTMSVDTESIEMSIDGNALPPPPKSPPNTLVIRSDRTLVSLVAPSTAPTSEGFETRMYNATTVVFPDKPIGVGDTWKREVKPDAALAIRAATASHTVVAFEKLGSANAVKISMSFHETAAEGIKVDGDFWIDLATGEDLKSEIEFRNVTFPGIGPVNGSIRTLRIAGGTAPGPAVSRR